MRWLHGKWHPTSAVSLCWGAPPCWGRASTTGHRRSCLVQAARCRSCEHTGKPIKGLTTKRYRVYPGQILTLVRFSSGQGQVIMVGSIQANCRQAVCLSAAIFVLGQSWSEPVMRERKGFMMRDTATIVADGKKYQTLSNEMDEVISTCATQLDTSSRLA